MSKITPTLLIPVLICCFLLFSSWAAYRAVTQVSDITDRDYYSKGLKYSNTILEKKTASVLGWQLQSRLNDGALIQVLVDGNGEPIIGATAHILLQLEQNSLLIPLVETAPGTYSTPLPKLSGNQVIRSEFERDGARISRRILLAI